MYYEHKVFDVTKFIKSPFTIIRIEWIVDNSSGATECEAWRGQHEIDSLTQAGYEIKTISLVQIRIGAQASNRKD